VTDVRVFTWNVNTSARALELLASHLRDAPAPWIVGLQEVSAGEEWLTRHGFQQLAVARHRVVRDVERHTWLIASPDVERVAHSAMEYPRIAAQRVRVGGRNLDFAVIHAPSPANVDSEAEKRRHSYWRELDRVLTDRAGEPPLVLFGDFNLDPFDRLALLDVGLLPPWEQPRRTHSTSPRHTLRCHGWRSIGSPGQPPGTCYFSGAGPLRWHWNDRFVVAPEAGEVTSLRILDRLAGSPLVPASGLPSKDHLSDHLPVELVLATGDHP
jgi:endonuclease/exonuclease/phosphatase family metal-dependent hydrolase